MAAMASTLTVQMTPAKRLSPIPDCLIPPPAKRQKLDHIADPREHELDIKALLHPLSPHHHRQAGNPPQSQGADAQGSLQEEDSRHEDATSQLRQSEEKCDELEKKLLHSQSQVKEETQKLEQKAKEWRDQETARLNEETSIYRETLKTEVKNEIEKLHQQAEIDHEIVKADITTEAENEIDKIKQYATEQYEKLEKVVEDKVKTIEQQNAVVEAKDLEIEELKKQLNAAQQANANSATALEDEKKRNETAHNELTTKFQQQHEAEMKKKDDEIKDLNQQRKSAKQKTAQATAKVTALEEVKDQKEKDIASLAARFQDVQKTLTGVEGGVSEMRRKYEGREAASGHGGHRKPMKQSRPTNEIGRKGNHDSRVLGRNSVSKDTSNRGGKSNPQRKSTNIWARMQSMESSTLQWKEQADDDDDGYDVSEPQEFEGANQMQTVDRMVLEGEIAADWNEMEFSDEGGLPEDDDEDELIEDAEEAVASEGEDQDVSIADDEEDVASEGEDEAVSIADDQEDVAIEDDGVTSEGDEDIQSEDDEEDIPSEDDEDITSEDEEDDVSIKQEEEDDVYIKQEELSTDDEGPPTRESTPPTEIIHFNDITDPEDRWYHMQNAIREGNIEAVPNDRTYYNSLGTAAFRAFTANGRNFEVVKVEESDYSPDSNLRVIPLDLKKAGVNDKVFNNMCIIAKHRVLQIEAAEQLDIFKVDPLLFAKFKERMIKEARHQLWNTDVPPMQSMEDFGTPQFKDESDQWEIVKNALIRMPKFRNACKFYAEGATCDSVCWPPEFMLDEKQDLCTLYNTEAERNQAMRGAETDADMSSEIASLCAGFSGAVIEKREGSNNYAESMGAGADGSRFRSQHEAMFDAEAARKKAENSE